jgi:hypothetical protein
MAVTTVLTNNRYNQGFSTVSPVEGVNAVILVTDKDNIAIPTESNGTSPVYTNANAVFKVFDGNTDVTSLWTLSVSSSTNITGTLSSGTYTVSAITADFGTITIRAFRTGYDSLYRTINVTKIKKGLVGAQGVTGTIGPTGVQGAEGPAGDAGTYTYVAFADDNTGTGFSLTFTTQSFFAILVSDTEVVTPIADDFAGLWVPLTNTPVVPSYKELSILCTDSCAWNSLGMTHVALRPQSYYYRGTYNRIYFVLFNWHLNAHGTVRQSPNNVNSTKVGYYDIDKKYFSALTDIPHLYPLGTDGHDYPSMIVTDDGYIIVAKEQLVHDSGKTLYAEGDGLHNSPIEIWKSSAPEDISIFTNTVTFTTTTCSYPTFTKGSSNGEIFMTLRQLSGTGVSGHSGLSLIKSVDNGDTWKALDDTVNTPKPFASCYQIIDGPTDWYFYTNSANGPRDNGISLFGILNEGGSLTLGGVSPDGSGTVASRNKVILYLHSDDGINWENAQSQFGTTGAFTKDVTAVSLEGSMLTPAELLAHFVVDRCDTDLYKSFGMQDVTTSPTGIPYAIYKYVDRFVSTANPNYSGKEDVVHGEYMVYFDVNTADWVTVDISKIDKESFEVDAGEETKYSYTGSRKSLIIFDDGILDIIGQKVITSDDIYNLPVAITDSTKVIHGGIFRVTTTQTNYFGGDNNNRSGIVAGNYYLHTLDKTLSSLNSLTYLKTKTYFKRSYDNGITWTDVREPIDIPGNNYVSSNPICAYVANSVDSGVVGVFIGVSRTIPGGTAYDHSDIVLVWDKINR